MNIYLESPEYREAKWGPPTAHMNFCEEDYQLTPYIAEFVNTLTNLTYIFLGCRGLRNNWYRAAKSATSNLPYVALIFVGIGSALYHASLKYSMQLIDDNSMLFGAAIVLHRALTFESNRLSQLGLAMCLCLMLIIVIWSHIKLEHSALHQVSFVTMIGITCYRTFSSIEDLIKDATFKQRMHSMAFAGLGFIVSGYLLWLTDVFACSQLRATRHIIGLPLAWLLELHGWWHILTGVGVYLYIVLVECLYVADKDGTSALEHDWLGLVSIRRKDHRRKDCRRED